jgi:hypothetical protein
MHGTMNIKKKYLTQILAFILFVRGQQFCRTTCAKLGLKKNTNQYLLFRILSVIGRYLGATVTYRLGCVVPFRKVCFRSHNMFSHISCQNLTH